MGTCEDVDKRVHELAALDTAALPSWAMDHLAACPTCTRSLMRTRLARGLFDTAKQGQEPSADFPRRVLAALPPTHIPRHADPDLWRLGWRLVPAFAAPAVLLLILFQFDASIRPTPAGPTPGLAPGLAAGLAPDEALSASERLVLGAAPPDLDLVLTAVLERDGR